MQGLNTLLSTSMESSGWIVCQAARTPPPSQAPCQWMFFHKHEVLYILWSVAHNLDPITQALCLLKTKTPSCAKTMLANQTVLPGKPSHPRHTKPHQTTKQTTKQTTPNSSKPHQTTPNSSNIHSVGVLHEAFSFLRLSAKTAKKARGAGGAVGVAAGACHSVAGGPAILRGEGGRRSRGPTAFGGEILRGVQNSHQFWRICSSFAGFV